MTNEVQPIPDTDKDDNWLLSPKQIEDRGGPSASIQAKRRCYGDPIFPYVNVGRLKKVRLGDWREYVRKNRQVPNGDAA